MTGLSLHIEHEEFVEFEENLTGIVGQQYKISKWTFGWHFDFVPFENTPKSWKLEEKEQLMNQKYKISKYQETMQW